MDLRILFIKARWEGIHLKIFQLLIFCTQKATASTFESNEMAWEMGIIWLGK